MKKKLPLIIITLFAALMAFTVSAAAFDGNDYDYGGGDWGGSDWGSDWGDSDSSSGGGFVFLGDGSDGDDGGIAGGVIAGIVIVIIIISVLTTLGKKKGHHGTVISGQGGGQGRNVNLPDRTAQIESLIKSKDESFTASDFVTFAKQVYMDIEDAWCKRDLKPVRPVMHENLYNTTAKQVQSKIEQGVVYHYESIAINTAYLTSLIVDREFEYLTVYLNARMIDYQTDEKTGNVIRGDKNTRWDMRYKMKFVRTLGIKTNPATAKTDGHNCPNCGAPLEISSSGVCEYCGSVVTTGLYSWVLTDFTTVRNDTVDEGVRVPNEYSDNGNNNNNGQQL